MEALSLRDKNFNLGIILGLAIAYFLAGRIGLLFALPPGIVTPFWPPTGVALATLLFFGPSVWPGVFLGSFLTNTWPFDSLDVVPTNIGIAAGTSLQTLTAFYLLQFLGVNYQNFFQSYKKVFFFLLTAFVSCLISATIGSLSIYFSGIVSPRSFGESWLTWWLGDTMGICIFTPFFLIWYTPIDWKKLSKQYLELIGLLFLITFTSLLCFVWLKKPLAFIFIPLLLWTTFRFSSHIVMIALLIISGIAIWGTIQGQGPFIQSEVNNSLLILQAFIGVATATMLILMTVLNELTQTHELLEQYNKELEAKVSERTLQLHKQTEVLQERNQTLENTLHQLQMMQSRIITQEKLASLGALTVGLARQMQNPLNFVINFSDLCLDQVNELEGLLAEEKSLSDESRQLFSDALAILRTNLAKVYQYGKNANRIVERMVFHIQERTGNYQLVDLNALVEEFTNLTYYSLQAQHPHLYARIEKQYDKTIEKIETIPDDVIRAFVNILTNAFDSVIEKHHQLGDTFTPTILIKTQNRDQQVAIIIRDNGKGISKDMQTRLFVPFSTTKQGEGAGFGLSISQDMIVHNLDGEILVSSEEGEFAEFTILLPKQAKKLTS